MKSSLTLGRVLLLSLCCRGIVGSHWLAWFCLLLDGELPEGGAQGWLVGSSWYLPKQVGQHFGHRFCSLEGLPGAGGAPGNLTQLRSLTGALSMGSRIDYVLMPARPFHLKGISPISQLEKPRHREARKLSQVSDGTEMRTQV